MAAILTGGWRGALIGLHMAGGRLLAGFLMPFIAGFGRFMRLMSTGSGIIRALGGALSFMGRLGWISRVGAFIMRLLPWVGRAIAGISNPIGWIVIGLTLLGQYWEH